MRRRQAFTLIEVSLVIVVTVIIFLAFILSVGSSVSGQRYSDSTQNFAEFLRNQYSAVINVQNNQFGNTDQAIYGRLITFGEVEDTVYTYDIIGNAYTSSNPSSDKGIVDSLQKIGATVLYEDISTSCTLRPVNEASYTLLHGAWLETTEARNSQGRGASFTGSLIIARSPVSGVVSTVFSSDIIRVQSKIGSACSSANLNILKDALDKSSSTPGHFQAQQLDFCIASDDQPDPNVRRDVRLIKDGKSTSAVQILGQEEGDNLCNS